jgi:hypothetical protein
MRSCMYGVCWVWVGEEAEEKEEVEGINAVEDGVGGGFEPTPPLPLPLPPALSGRLLSIGEGGIVTGA